MSEQLLELARELRDRWDDAYFWADHQLLQAVLCAIALGTIGLAFKYLEQKMIQTMSSPPEVST